MALGLEVTKEVLNMKAAQAVLNLREAFEDVEVIAKWLSHHPVVDGVDPLTTDPFGYNEDEAYALRLYFETFSNVKSTNSTAFDAGQKMTGLE